MFKLSFAKSALVGGATVAGVGILAAAAFATVPTYHISAGAKKSGTIGYSAAAKPVSGKPAINFQDTTSKNGLTCNSGTATGVMNLGKVFGTQAGTITSTSWSTCKALGALKVTPTQNGKWYLNGDAPTVNGVTKMHVSNVNATITSAFGCTFTVKGSADGSYNNSTGKLSFAPRASSGHVLKITSATGCSTLASKGDKATFRGVYIVTPANKSRLKITN